MQTMSICFCFVLFFTIAIDSPFQLMRFELNELMIKWMSLCQIDGISRENPVLHYISWKGGRYGEVGV